MCIRDRHEALVPDLVLPTCALNRDRDVSRTSWRVYTVMTTVRLVPPAAAIDSNLERLPFLTVMTALLASVRSRNFNNNLLVQSVPIRHEHSFEHTRVCNLIM